MCFLRVRPLKTKIETTYRIVIRIHTYQDRVYATSHFKFQVYISILGTVSKELAKLWYQKKKAFTKNPTAPTVFKAHPSNFAYTLTTKLQRASKSWIFDFHPQSTLKNSKFTKNFSRSIFWWNFEFRLLLNICGRQIQKSGF